MELIIAVLIVAIAFMALILLVSYGITRYLMAVSKKQVAREWEQDRQKVLACLPGTDCGQCGFDTCEAFAQALLEQDIQPEACPEAAQNSELSQLLQARQELLEARRTAAENNRQNHSKRRTRTGSTKGGIR